MEFAVASLLEMQGLDPHHLFDCCMGNRNGKQHDWYGVAHEEKCIAFALLVGPLAIETHSI